MFSLSLAELGLDTRALPRSSSQTFLEQRGRSGVDFLLDSKKQELISDGQQLSGAMFEQPYKEQKWFESLNESQSVFIYFLKPHQALSRVWLWCMADGSGDVSLLYT